MADNSGSIYVAGYRAVGGNIDCVTIKYNSSGDTLWVETYDGPGPNSQDWATAIAIDGSGNVYVAGTSFDDEASGYLVIKYLPTGDTLWVRKYQGSQVYDMVVDAWGNVYVTGDGVLAGAGEDFLTIKCSADGDTAWVRVYNGPGDYQDWAHAIAVDGAGNAYVTGLSVQNTTSPYNFDYATIKYSPLGEEVWVERYDGPVNGWDFPYGIAVDGSGNAYVTGKSTGIGTNYDCATIKYVRTAGLLGDANGDGIIDIGDVVYLISYLYKNGPAPQPLEVGDVNCDGVVDIGDVVYLINYLFRGGPPPDC